MNKGVFITVLFAVFCVFAKGQESLHVVSEPDVVVYINGKIKGFTSLKQGGLHIDNIGEGNQKITLYKLKHIIQEDSIFVQKGENLTYYASRFVVNEDDLLNDYMFAQNQPNGALKIQSIPVGINIEIPDLGISTSKTEDKLLVSRMKCGVYEMYFTWNSKKVKHSIEIKEGTETHIFVNMLKNQLIDKSIGAQSDPQEMTPLQVATID